MRAASQNLNNVFLLCSRRLAIWLSWFGQQHCDARRCLRPPWRRRGDSSAPPSAADDGAAGERCPTPRAATSRVRASPSTTAGARSRNCPRSRRPRRWRKQRRGYEPHETATATYSELHGRKTPGPKYPPRVTAIGTNPDPYQPIERQYEVMRGILEVLDRASHPVGIVTKSALVLRDIDILARMARRNLVKVALSVTSLDPKLARVMEPRAATPPRRLDALRKLAEAGIPTTVMVAPVIPAINDMEIERILDAAAAAGVKEAGYVLLRLPLELRELFREWLIENFPDRHRHVFKLIRDMRGGKDYDAKWGERMTGSGPIAWMIGRRFEAACERLGLNRRKLKLATEHFTPTRKRPQQLSLL